MKNIQGLKRERLVELLDKMSRTHAVLIGDMCIDIYWVGDMTRSRLSRETPHYPLPIVEERMSAGAGGNAAVNLATLCPDSVTIGIIGDDWIGQCLKSVFEKKGMNTDGIVIAPDKITNAYCKPMRKGYLGIEVEDPRLDFESFDAINKTLEDQIIEKIEKYATEADVICVSDQFENGCITENVRNVINRLASSGKLVVVDSRSRIGLYNNCILKPNEIECARATDSAPLDSNASEQDIRYAAQSLKDKTGSDVCLTLGSRGCYINRKDSTTRIEAIKVEPPVDTVGAGDCFLPAFSLALAAGASEAEAGIIGSMASAICVKKLNTTGSATAEELLELFDSKGA